MRTLFLMHMVMFYGKGETAEIKGQVKTIQNTTVSILFSYDNQLKEASVPKNIIEKKNGMTISGSFVIDDIMQKYSLPKWFLKRNRIIPIIDI